MEGKKRSSRSLNIGGGGELKLKLTLKNTDRYFYEENTELHHAAFNGDLKVVQQLLEMGAEIDALSYLRSPLLIACGSVENSFLGPDKSLLGADSSGKRPPRTPYFHQDIAKYLIEKGANINFRDGTRRSALDFSCQAGNLEIVTQLLNLKAKINREGFSTLHYALRGGNLDVIRLILESDKINYVTANSRCYYEGTPLHMAISQMWNHPHIVEICRYLLKACANVNTKNDITMETPLDLVCKNRASPAGLLRLLLEYQADIHPQGDVSPLRYLFGEVPLDEREDILSGCEVEKMTICLRYISEMNITDGVTWPQTRRELSNIYTQIIAELELMNNPISELNQMSFLDLFRKDFDTLGCMFEVHKHINDVVFNIIKQLPFFGYPVKKKYLQIRSRRSAFLLACNVVYKYVCSYKIPLEIVEKFCQFLTISDLQSLSNVVKNENMHGKNWNYQNQRNDSEWFAGLNPLNPPSFLFDANPSNHSYVFVGWRDHRLIIRRVESVQPERPLQLKFVLSSDRTLEKKNLRSK